MIYKYPSYSVAIRTLGTAGDKYVKEIQSVYNQSHKADDVFVYIPYGYSVAPVMDEKYIKCEKGMIRQRALPFSEIDSEYILFLDDDIYLPENAIKELFDALLEHKADCISVCLFDTNTPTLKKHLINIIFAGSFPTLSKEYAFIVRNDSHFSYCINPEKVMLTQSASGGCFLCKKRVYSEAHFENELWMDEFQYPLGEDQLFFYKLFKIGKRVLIHNQSNILHLDARSGNVKNKKQRDYNSRILRFIIWHRTIYSVKKSFMGKIGAILSFSLDYLRSILESIFRLLLGEMYAFPNCIKALLGGIKYVSSERYKHIPKYF